MRHSVNAEQPMDVPESTETTEDTSDSADELYKPVTVEDVEFQSPRKKRRTKQKLLLLRQQTKCLDEIGDEEAEIDVDTLPDKKNA
eukprot:Em0004g1177a